jgi:hypothetical protein
MKILVHLRPSLMCTVMPKISNKPQIRSFTSRDAPDSNYPIRQDTRIIENIWPLLLVKKKMLSLTSESEAFTFHLDSFVSSGWYYANIRMLTRIFDQVSIRIRMSGIRIFYQPDIRLHQNGTGTLMKRPRTKRPIDFSSQKFCNEMSLGQKSQNGPWDKAVLGHTSLDKFATKRPHFQGRTIRPWKLNLALFFRTRRSWPTTNMHFDFSHIFYCIPVRSFPVYNTFKTNFYAATAPRLLPPWPCPDGPALAFRLWRPRRDILSQRFFVPRIVL